MREQNPTALDDAAARELLEIANDGHFFQDDGSRGKQQRGLETKIAAARVSRDDLAARLKVAEAAAASLRENAASWSSDGGDDNAGRQRVTAAENAMRRERDRAATLSDAIEKVVSPLPTSTVT